jgi:hypothetical protein
MCVWDSEELQVEADMDASVDKIVLLIEGNEAIQSQG